MGFNYPITLDLNNKKCTVIGGGKVAERKVFTLLSTGAKIDLVSPTITYKLKELVYNKRINWIKSNFSFDYIKDSFLVIAATNKREINKKISAYCHDNSKLVNVVDSVTESNFIVNSFYKQGDLMLAVSTNGKSPALSRKIKEDFKKAYGPEYAVLLNILGEIREYAKENIIDEKKRNEFFRYIVETDILDLLKEGREKEVKERVKKCLLSF